MRVDIAPNIDGNLDENIWEKSQKAINFVMLEPGDGTPEREAQRTVVQVLYDNTAIYIGATLYDDEPTKILRELGQRDEGGKNTDMFIFSINPYNDGQQVFNFIVTAAGVQMDSKYTQGDEDANWNAVWDSKVVIGDKGWVVEIKIPYSELRFPEKKEQIWGLNFLRTVKRLNEEYTWNYIDKSVGEFTQHYGELKGITDIKPPTRLSFMPYVSGYVDDYSDKTNFSYNLGMDLKYGINESFTLDMTLIPDFGQAAYDEQVLNLGPFEVRYDENRQFFTEGTEMFSKGNLFYSRRIGGVPSKYYDVQYGTDAVEFEILENPSKTPLINATKVSGRTKGGLGVGVFNAITNSTTAKVKSRDRGEVIEIETEPLANYNVFVLDQRFNNNSSVTLINTNVMRSGEFRDANVTGLLFDISNKENSYKVFGEGKYSYIAEQIDSVKQGYQTMFGIEKTKGKFRFEHETRLTSQNYDNTDLGFMRYSNIWEIDTDISYEIFEPTGNFNSFKFIFGVFHDRQFMPDHFIKVDLLLRGMATTLDFFSFGGDISVSPVDKIDFYEPRVEGRYLRIPSNAKIGGWLSTDFRKKFAIEVYSGYRKFSDWDKDFFYFGIEPRYRVNDKFVLNFELSRYVVNNDVGFVGFDNSDIIMGFRDQKILESSVGSSFTFNNKMSMNLNFRHYWADIAYSDYKKLTDDGYLDDTGYNKEHDTTFNSWNVDLSYSWWFAPGSQISVLYRNSLLSEFETSGFDYLENLEKMFDNSPQNVLSIKLVYYLDYNNIRQIF
ncbi:MAG: carbohydrate binding family 9 domain-containing protein [Flavobacteriales bacterium]|nr:carbohydrate binding family 9 domain-containing protein [Flavobacteriales bacterium]